MESKADLHESAGSLLEGVGNKMKFFEKHKKRKIILLVFLFLILLIIGIYASIIWTLHKGMVDIVEQDEIDEEILLSEKVPIIEEEQKKPEVFNVLLVGSDSRDPAAEKGRSDTMILLSYNEEENKASVVSFMRDTLIEIPGHGQTKLGHSYAYGGIGLTINTINQNYGLDIQKYVTINLDNLVNVIEKLGGIEITLTAEEVAYYRKSGHSFKEGTNHMNGEEALMHARNRSLDSDFGRTIRQRAVLNAVYKKMMQTKDPSMLLSLIQYCLSQVKTNMSVELIYEMSLKVIAAENLKVQQESIPTLSTYRGGTYEGMSVLFIDLEENKKVLEELLY